MSTVFPVGSERIFSFRFGTEAKEEEERGRRRRGGEREGEAKGVEERGRGGRRRGEV